MRRDNTEHEPQFEGMSIVRRAVVTQFADAWGRRGA